MKLRLSHAVVAAPIPADRPLDAVRRSRVPEVAAMFGLGPSATGEPRAVVVVPEVELDLRPGEVVFVTGPSGGGKTTLLRLIDEAAAQRGAEVVRFDALPPLPDEPLVDALAAFPLDRVLHALSLAGLGDAFVMLSRPAELSDGQRYRLRLAQTILALPRDASGRAAGDPVIVLADEFGATLDRITAQAVARNVRRWVRQTAACFVAATSHDDLLEPLEPDVLVEKPLDGGIQVLRRGPTPA